MRATIQDVDVRDEYWNVDLDVLPVIGHTLVMGSAPKGTHHEVVDVVHHIGSGEQRIVVSVRKSQIAGLLTEKSAEPIAIMPIRDAPKDGTPILLWTNGRWIEGRWDEYANDPWSDSDEGYWKLRWAETAIYSVTPERQPTHWLPVPADPTKDNP
ncbi:hypothetical protein [Mesorhizobium sp. B2-1-2]|uniref:hypothetical protein n=1 Tax=Mesorhizobium sp. B2-1-2 TaxID=2589973 RepID=UPI00112B4467|nr:hypothetical protein [Mesorhizobium sp. B2-1-2]TPN04503.1 hypothetical protein FJ971_29600 [Mesorhizobium sp. B2-1-2]